MRARILAVTAGLAIALLVVPGAGAAASPTKLDLSTPQAVDAYLVSKGIDPAKVVKQIGLKNYAGPASGCPGLGWNCTTASQVAQIALAGGENRATCTDGTLTEPPATPTSQTCVITQGGPGTNHAACKEHLGTEPAVQNCMIGQTGDRNYALVEQVIDQSEGPTQDADQTADVDQVATQRNQSDIHQMVKQRTSEGTAQTQDAYQRADVNQTATGSDNFSHVHQTQDQDESGAAMDQTQNGPANLPAVCLEKKANQCAIVKQDNEGGKNESHLHQAIGERQTTKKPVATQTQGDVVNGNEGDVHQENPTGVGQNHDFAYQVVAQRQASPAGVSTQKQYTDPTCCGASQIGGEINREYITEATTQSADETEVAPVQESVLFGQVHEESGGGFTTLQVADPNNQCRIAHHARTNTDSENAVNSGDGAECMDLFLTTTCTTAGCTSMEAPPECIGVACLPPPCEEICLTSTPPTFGKEIAMPDYGEPADYPGVPTW